MTIGGSKLLKVETFKSCDIAKSADSIKIYQGAPIRINKGFPCKTKGGQAL